jgi:hypothetical protein
VRDPVGPCPNASHPTRTPHIRERPMSRRRAIHPNSVERRRRAEEERRRRETAALLYRLGFPRCCCCNRIADDVVVSGNAQLPMAYRCAMEARGAEKVPA